MKSSKTLSILATAAAVTFGGVAIAQSTTAPGTNGTNATIDSPVMHPQDSRVGDLSAQPGTTADTSQSNLDTQSMGAGSSTLNTDASLNSDSGTLDNDASVSGAGNYDMLEPRADRN